MKVWAFMNLKAFNTIVWSYKYTEDVQLNVVCKI